MFLIFWNDISVDGEDPGSRQLEKKSAGINYYNGYKESDVEEIDRIYQNKAAFFNK